MKIAVINGSNRHGSTWHCMDQFREQLSKYDKIETTEFFLPKDMPHFCNGCFSCFYNGEDTCPHASDIRPFIDAITSADLVVLTSPVYALDASGQLKALLDHLCFMWISHRPDPGMFSKVGLTVTTTAGMGLRHTTKTMTNSLRFWGVKKIYSFKSPVSASKWSDVPERKVSGIKKETERLARKIYRSVKNIDRLRKPLITSIIFRAMSGMMKKNTWNERDKSHWKAQGWI